MARSETEWEQLAREAAARIDRQRELSGQLSFFPEDAAQGEDEDRAQGDGEGDDAPKAGRPKGAKNKGSSQLRDYLAAQGCRMPEDVLAEVAGLNSRDDAVSLAMRQTERVLAWAFDGAHIPKKGAPKATAALRLQVFQQQYGAILSAAAAILPYVAAKASPEVQVNDNRTFIVPTAPARRDPASGARDVTPPAGGRMVPRNVAHQIEQKQTLSADLSDASDGDTRTAPVSVRNQKGNSDAETD